MKKKKIIHNLPKVSADFVANNLRKTYPKNSFGKGDKALSIATSLARNLDNISPQDINPDIFPMKDVKRNANIWKQVVNILSKK